MSFPPPLLLLLLYSYTLAGATAAAADGSVARTLILIRFGAMTLSVISLIRLIRSHGKWKRINVFKGQFLLLLLFC